MIVGCFVYGSAVSKAQRVMQAAKRTAEWTKNCRLTGPGKGGYSLVGGDETVRLVFCLAWERSLWSKTQRWRVSCRLAAM
jgi:hypothetical protein